MKELTPWYDIPLERENDQLPQYVDYNLFPLNIYEYQLHNMLILNSPTWLCFSRPMKWTILVVTMSNINTNKFKQFVPNK
jgi:hypothetical protein